MAYPPKVHFLSFITPTNMYRNEMLMLTDGLLDNDGHNNAKQPFHGSRAQVIIAMLRAQIRTMHRNPSLVLIKFGVIAMVGLVL